MQDVTPIPVDPTTETPTITAADETPATEAGHPERTSLLSESRFARERELDADAAVASLDETVVRPPLERIDFPDAPPETSHGQQAGQGSQGTLHRRPAYYDTPYQQPPIPSPPQQPHAKASSAARRPYWRILGVAAVLIALIVAIATRAQSPRSSTVGLFGVNHTASTEDAADQTVNLSPVVVVPEAEVEEDAEEEPEEDDWSDGTSGLFRYNVVPRTDDAEGDSDGESEDSVDSYYYVWSWPTDESDDDDYGPYGTLTQEKPDDSATYLTYDDGRLTYNYGYGDISVDLEELGYLYEYLFTPDAGGGSDTGYGTSYMTEGPHGPGGSPHRGW